MKCEFKIKFNNEKLNYINRYQAFVGTPKISYFQKIIGRSNLIVGTEHNVVANLNLRTNSISKNLFSLYFLNKHY